jgi:hypothetical protein
MIFDKNTLSKEQKQKISNYVIKSKSDYGIDYVFTDKP